MSSVTTIRVSTELRDQIKRLAQRDGVSMDAAIEKLLRLERQRVMGEELHAREASDEDAAWVSASSGAVGRALG